MSDLHRIMKDGVPDPEPGKKLPSILPWGVVALVLVLISIGIKLFWPLPASKPLPQCTEHVQEACVRSVPQPGTP